MTDKIKWLLLLVQVPSEPSRHRVAVWRTLRKTGAVPVISGTWAIPDIQHFSEGIQKVQALCQDAGGTFAVLSVQAKDAASQEVLERSFTNARNEEWTEFLSDCGKFEQEISKEIAKEKFTYAELEEEEQSLERLRRWFRDLKKRDVLKLTLAKDAEDALQLCARILEDYAQMVYSRGSNE